MSITIDEFPFSYKFDEFSHLASPKEYFPYDKMDRNIAQFFDKNGYIGNLDVLDKDETDELKSKFKTFENEIGITNAQYSLHNVHVTYPWVLKLASHPNLLEPIKQILGNNLILLDSRFICKYPEAAVPRKNGEKAYVAWHQDVRYWGVSGDVVSVWLAVDDADVDNGCMFVIPGTHKSGILEHRQADVSGNLLTSNQEIPSHLYNADTAVPCPLKAGQMSLHHGHIVHGSGPNQSDRRRCGYVIRYVATSAHPIDDPERPRKFESTVLVCGEDEFKNFNDNAPGWFSRNQSEVIVG